MTAMATTVAVATVGSRQKAQPIALPCVSLVAHPVVAHTIQTKMALSVWMTCSLFWPTMVTQMFHAVAVKSFVMNPALSYTLFSGLRQVLLARQM